MNRGASTPNIGNRRQRARVKVAGVTGGSGGLAKGIALALAEAGYEILLFDLEATAPAAQATIELVASVGREARFVALDVTDVESIPAALELGAEQLGPPAVWVNNAGVVARRPALEVSRTEWQRVIDVCLTGAFFCSQAFARTAISGGGACIVNVTSIFGLVGGPNRAAYSAAKAGLVNLTRVLAYEWHPAIRVNAVAPTFADTPMTTALMAGGLDVMNRALGERLASIADVGSAVRFLASDEASMITGHTLPIEGGWLAW
jgi:NAD(P)-dependent dehydrogenase (short-subunit alcohol dehydrogenase family)